MLSCIRTHGFSSAPIVTLISTSRKMVRRRQVTFTIVAVLILGCQSIGNFAWRPALEERGTFAEKLSQATSDNAAESARKFQRLLPEQHTKVAPVECERKNNEAKQHENQHDHGRLLSGKPPKMPPVHKPPQDQTGDSPPPQSSFEIGKRP